MKILITGGAGFIGSHLCQRLAKDGHHITIVDSLLPQVHGDNPEQTSPTYQSVKGLGRFIEGDVSSLETWKALYYEIFDVVICLAAETGTGQSMMKAHSYCSSNIGSIALLNDLTVKGLLTASKVILASSRSVYGDAKLDKKGNPKATKETDPTNPRSIYAVTKLTQEQILFSGFPNSEVSALRFQNVYGPGQSLINPYTGILSIFTTAIRNNENIYLFGDGQMSRDFVYVTDVVDSIVCCIEASNVNREVYNVGSGIRTTVEDVAKFLKWSFDSDVQIIKTGEAMRGDIRHNFADISKISKIGFKPQVPIEIGVPNFLNWTKQHTVISSYKDSIQQLRQTGVIK